MYEKKVIEGWAKSEPYGAYVMEENTAWADDVLDDVISSFDGKKIRVTVEIIEE